MKRNIKRMIAGVLSVSFLLSTGTTSQAAKVKLSTSSKTLTAGKSTTITLKNVSKANAKKITWTSSKKAVATVKATSNKAKAKVTAKKAGTTTITAKLAKKKYTCKVKVKSADIYVEVTPTPRPGNLTYQSDVTAEMTKASYWINKNSDADKVLMSQDQIQAKNQKFYADSATYMHDLKNITETFDPAKKREDLAAALMSDVRKDRLGTRTTIYKSGVAMDTQAIDTWFDRMKANILNSTDNTGKVKYAICTERADMWMAPNSEPIGWSLTDPDDEFIDTSMNVNEPLVVEAVTADGKFFYGKNTNCSGWVLADHFAICDDKEEWIRQWDPADEDVLVVTTSHISLEKSTLAPETSGVDLMLGTVLPLVPKDQMPTNIAERGTWYNYVVYLPTRDSVGKLVKSVALISSHHYVNVGYLPLTKRNIMYVAFSCLGDRYGWGGMLGAMDCSQYTRSIYRCFGLELPRNTTWQRAMPTYKVDLSEMTEADKKKAISTLPTGSLLMFRGHITMYLGSEGGKQYVISDMGSMSETEESIGSDVKVQSMYCVSVNSLDVRRANGNTWLQEMLTGLVVWKD